MACLFDDDKHCVYIDQKDYYEDLIDKYLISSNKTVLIPHYAVLIPQVIRIRNGCYP